MQIPITEDLVNRLFSAEKFIKDSVVWKIENNSSWAKAELKVFNKIRAQLDVYININTAIPRTYSISLIYKKTYRIAGLDSNGSHKNKHSDQRRWISEVHFHVWTEKCRDTWAKDINSLDPDNELDIKNGFAKFCKLLNIEFRGGINELPPYQGELFEDIN